ncbi:C-C motif chemokine 20-like [Myxocyprinus asiaticus]|uniref:C-C motif chemokine 20-like n=1 Tax=Myxocyprinus asiaticus TaxID=70543 RepID=UPI002223D118|nr:C-C motif chemokine 20-like [Myxocyprinus asiaticus]
MINVKICTLCFLILGAFIIRTESVSCCLRYTKRPIRCGSLKGYDIQGITRSCDIPAIIFHTENGKSICADPAQRWTQNRVACLKVKAANMKTGSMF